MARQVVSGLHLAPGRIGQVRRVRLPHGAAPPGLTSSEAPGALPLRRGLLRVLIDLIGLLDLHLGLVVGLGAGVPGHLAGLPGGLKRRLGLWFRADPGLGARSPRAGPAVRLPGPVSGRSARRRGRARPGSRRCPPRRPRRSGLTSPAVRPASRAPGELGPGVVAPRGDWTARRIGHRGRSCSIRLGLGLPGRPRTRRRLCSALRSGRVGRVHGGVSRLRRGLGYLGVRDRDPLGQAAGLQFALGGHGARSPGPRSLGPLPPGRVGDGEPGQVPGGTSPRPQPAPGPRRLWRLSAARPARGPARGRSPASPISACTSAGASAAARSC